MTPDQQPLTKQDLHEALDALVQTLSARLDAIGAKQDATDSRLDTIAATLDATDSHLDTIAAKQDATDSRLDTIAAKQDATDSRLDTIAAKQDATDSRLDAAVQSFNARLDAAVQSFNARLDAAVQTLIDRQERMAEAFAHNLTDLRGELMQQLELLHNRTERTEINISSILMQLAGMNKTLGSLDRAGAQATFTQAAQQRAIDDLYAQLAELKRRISQQ